VEGRRGHGGKGNQVPRGFAVGSDMLSEDEGARDGDFGKQGEGGSGLDLGCRKGGGGTSRRKGEWILGLERLTGGLSNQNMGVRMGCLCTRVACCQGCKKARFYTDG
jgi:hypothetical protein